MARHLQVLLHGRRLGRLTQTDSGRLEFAYSGEWVQSQGAPLSLSLPVRTATFNHRESEPFFGGLLPEEGVRDRVARYLGVSSRNDFALLERIGGECAGAVALVPDAVAEPDATGGPAATASISDPLSPEQLVQLLDDLPSRPLLVGGEIRLSLAGAQDKVAVSLVDRRIALPSHDQPTTHILKTPIAHFDDTVANELLCMRTAARSGLRVAAVERRVVEGREFLLVERFDREQRAGRTVRLHQEDLCQALGVPTRMKYQAEGGPSLADCFGLLTQQARRPAIDRLALLRAAIFNVLIGNTDAHAKNFSLLHGLHGTTGVTLTPLYDLLSTLVYPNLSPRYAMKIGSQAEFRRIHVRHWDALADAAKLAKPQVRRALAEACEVLPAALAEELAELPDGLADRPVVRDIADRTRERCEVTARRLSMRPG